MLDFELKDERDLKGLGSGSLKRGCLSAGADISFARKLFPQTLGEEMEWIQPLRL